VTITPSDSWGGAGLLGVTIRLDDYGGADERLIRVLEVEPSSPAAICGLVESQDYLLGTTADSFDSVSTLAQVLQKHVDQVVEVYVYNTDSDVVRVVALMPTYAWGGNGLLGAEVGTGYLHRLPMCSRDTIGSSVERKVRWVGMKPTHPAEQEQKQEPTLEVEPQLEMEVMDEESHEETHKTVQQVADHGNGARNNAKQPAEAAEEHSNGDVAPVQETTTKRASEPSSNAEAQPQAVAAPELASASEPSGEAKTEEAVHAQPITPSPDLSNRQQATSQTQQEAEPSAQATMPSPPVDAAALFAAPPPDAHQTSYASQFMPPPPMSRFRREQEGEVGLR